jgi:hypothetical protein
LTKSAFVRAKNLNWWWTFSEKNKRKQSVVVTKLFSSYDIFVL